MANIWEGYKQLKEGDTEKTTIKEVKKGVLGDYKSAEYFEKVESDKREEARRAPALHITMENGATLDIILPKNKSFGPKSILAAWEKTYHKLPEEGDEVTTERDESGFWRVSLKRVV